MSDLLNLSALKYSELQKIAKDVGIKANMKSEKLAKALEEYYQNKGVADTGSETKSSEPQLVLQENTDMETQDKSKSNEKKAEITQMVHKQPKKRGKKPLKSQNIGVNVDGKNEHKSKEEKVVKVERQKRKLSNSPKNNQIDETEGSDNESQPSKRQRGTFEIVPTPDAKEDKCESRPTKGRRGTFEIVPTPDAKGDKCEENEATCKRESLGEMLEVMKPDMTNDDLKQSLMAAIEKKVEKKLIHEDAIEGPTPQIPRFAAFLAKKKTEVKPITPGNKDWTKIHKKSFSKMDSIDVYLEKKKKRNASISKNISRAREVASKTREAILKLKNHKTPQPNKIRKGLPLPFQSPFKPTVTSTTALKLKFGGNAKIPVFAGQRTPGVLKKHSVGESTTKTTSNNIRRSPRNTENMSAIKVTESPVPQKNQTRKSIGVLNNTEKRKSYVTPFKPLNMTLDNQSTKKTFDLKASLSKPLTWKPYTGKLKAIEKKSNPAVTSKDRNTNFKAAPQKTSRVHRIAEAQGRRADKKFNDQMKRRGIVA